MSKRSLHCAFWHDFGRTQGSCRAIFPGRYECTPRIAIGRTIPKRERRVRLPYMPYRKSDRRPERALSAGCRIDSNGVVSGRLRAEQSERSVGHCVALLSTAFKLRREIMAQHIPSLYAFAMCHAIVRWDKSRRFNSHDLLDFIPPQSVEDRLAPVVRQKLNHARSYSFSDKFHLLHRRGCFVRPKPHLQLEGDSEEWRRTVRRAGRSSYIECSHKVYDAIAGQLNAYNTRECCAPFDSDDVVARVRNRVCAEAQPGGVVPRRRRICGFWNSHWLCHDSGLQGSDFLP